MRRREDRMWCGLWWGVLLGVVMMVLALIAMPQRPLDADTAPVVIERLAPGQALWDLAGRYAPGRDPRVWNAEVCRLNGWPYVPNLQAWRPFVVPDWRAVEAR